jgi:hypothetical protein
MQCPKNNIDRRCYTLLYTLFSPDKYTDIKQYLTKRHGDISQSKGMKYTDSDAVNDSNFITPTGRLKIKIVHFLHLCTFKTPTF